MTPTPSSVVYPASFIQERISNLALRRLDYETCVVVWALNGPFDHARWLRAVARLVGRHETLRTRLDRDDGHVVQVVDPDATIIGGWVDLHGRAAEPRSSLVAQLAAAAAEPFRLDVAPLMRYTMHLLGDDERLLVWASSHAIWDASCADVLARDIAALYTADRGIAPLPLQFRDVVRHERRPPLAADRRRAQALATGLRDNDEARDGESGYTATTYVIGRLPGDDERALAELARGAGCGIGIVVLAAYVLALRGELGRADITVGMLDANRDRPGHDALIACLVNVLIVPLRDGPTTSLGETLEHVLDGVFSAYDHRVPFEHQVSALGLDRQSGEKAIVDTLFNYQPSVREQGALRCAGGLELQPQMLQPMTTPMVARGPWAGARLCLCAVAAPDGGLALWLVHDVEAFPTDWTAGLATRLRSVIAQARQELVGKKSSAAER